MTENKKPISPPPTDDKTKDLPAAGPHAKPELVDDEKTPGAGSLPDERPTGDADAGVG